MDRESYEEIELSVEVEDPDDPDYQLPSPTSSSSSAPSNVLCQLSSSPNSTWKSTDSIASSGTSSGIEKSNSSSSTLASKILMKKRRPRGLNQFIDSITDSEISAVTDKLANFFFGCNIPFNVVESDHFKALIGILRPAYSKHIPSRKMLATNVLDSTYSRICAQTRESIGPEAVLIIDGWKNSSCNKTTVTTMLHNAKGAHLFLNAWDLSGESETGEKLASIVSESKQMAKEMYNADVYASVSDNASNMRKMGELGDIWHSNCSSHMGNLLAKDIVDKDMNIRVVQILKEFKKTNLQDSLLKEGGVKPVLPIDVRWCTYRDSYQNLIRNLPFMKRVACSAQSKVQPELEKLLFDSEFAQKVNDFIKLFDPVCTLINKCQSNETSIAEAANLWLNLSMPENFPGHIAAIESRRKKALNVYALSAYTLHPVYSDVASIRLSNEQSQKVQSFLVDNLSADGLKQLLDFQEKNGFFRTLVNKNVTDALVFWSSAKAHYSELSNLALRLHKIPASSAAIERVFSNWSFVHSQLRNRLSFEKSKKLLHVYYTLKVIDCNRSDDY